MTLTAFVPSIASDSETMIQSKLTALETDNDVRFIFANHPDWYLSIEPGRDVIELLIEGDRDD